MVFFFKYTATTEIDTYLHTLALHDALPIWRGHSGGLPATVRRACSRCLRGRIDAIASRTGSASKGRVDVPEPCRRSGTHPVGRSEEHTSELQSLMRISYAVFCLKKKTQSHDVHQSQTR